MNIPKRNWFAKLEQCNLERLGIIRPSSNRNPEERQYRILVVSVNWLGDVIFSSSVFSALKKQYPQAKISCLAVPGIKDILEMIPHIDEVIVYDEKGEHRGWLAKCRIIKKLKKGRFDAAFLLRASVSRSFLLFCAGIPQRVGYAGRKKGLFLTHKIQESEQKVHRAEHYLHIIESYGIKVKERVTCIGAGERERQEVNEMLKEKGIDDNGRFVVLNPGGNWDLKRWPIENFLKLTRYLHEKYGCKVVVSGAVKDDPLARYIVEPIDDDWAVDLTGKTNLKQLTALISRADVVVSADSGPLHLANAVGTPVIGIYGPTRPEVTGPRGEGRAIILQRDIGCNRKPCYYLQCPQNLCMRAITVEDVQKAIEQITNP